MQHANGIGLHAPAEAVFELKPEYERFVAKAGINDVGLRGSVRVSVYVDEQLLKQTAELKCKQPPTGIDVAIPPGVDGPRPAQLRIVVDDGGDGINDDHADIVNAGFVLGKNSRE